jgi:hypothetical protein
LLHAIEPASWPAALTDRRQRGYPSCLRGFFMPLEKASEQGQKQQISNRQGAQEDDADD